MLFMTSLMTGSLIAVSSSTWMGMWIGLEINLLSIIPLMNNSSNKFSSEASMKYFITQAIASSIIMFSIILMSKSLMELNTINLIFNSALLTKMGAAPFHFWMPEIMDGLSWLMCFIVLTIQKIAPMIILMYSNFNMIFFMYIIIFSLLVSSILGLNQISIRKIMAYSSINHISWMICSMLFMNSMWITYFIVYSLISMSIIMMCNYFNMFFINQIIFNLNQNFPLKLILIMNFLSLGGLPPFLGFMPKWITVQSLINLNQIFLSIIMIVLTLITLYYYLRISYSTLMFNQLELNYTMKPKFNEYFLYLVNFFTISGLILSTTLFNWL
uniref:NADH-ubiquinone oxidoreductase chain 2 n=1 Tax=Astenus lyonessius TaxID=347273 RepID=A0A0S2M6I8_9COLE|nr:NADH deshydrogenase subunit 2 [Astenus lyonessius]